MFLPDINVWIALTFRAHPHHPAASEWFDEVPEDSCAFCRMTQQGFLRLASNPRVMGKEALSLEKAWEKYDVYLGDPRVVVVPEPADLETIWRSYTRRRSFSSDVWSDAYLAAFARAASLDLVTFDKGMSQYRGVRVTVLS